MIIDYQQIVNQFGEFLQLAVPIALLFGVTNRLIRGLVDMVTGEKTIKF